VIPSIGRDVFSADILTFHPARLHLGGIVADALLDALNPWGGCFFVMTDGERFPGRDAAQRDAYFSGLGRIELEWGRGADAWRMPCRVGAYSLDEEGVAAYITLRFLDSDPSARLALENFMASLW